MHELSIAYSIVESASEALRVAGAGRVKTVHLKIGKLSGVVKDALLFCFDIATEGTPLAGAQLAIAELPVVVRCPDCDKNVTLPDVPIFRCPECGALTPELLQGKELELVSLELCEAAG